MDQLTPNQGDQKEIQNPQQQSQAPTKIKILGTVSTAKVQDAKTEVRTPVVQQQQAIKIIQQPKLAQNVQKENVQKEDQQKQIQEQNEKLQYYEKQLKLQAQIAVQRRQEELFKKKYQL